MDPAHLGLRQLLLGIAMLAMMVAIKTDATMVTA
jgi:hypothetical protein